MPAPQIRSTILALYKLVCMYMYMYVMSLEWVNLGNSKLLCRLMMTSTRVCMIDYTGRGCVLCHVTSLIFYKITDNVSKTVQNRDVVTMED